MGEKRFFRAQAVLARRAAAAMAPPRGPSIKDRIEAFNAALVESADINAVRSWSEHDAGTASTSASDVRVTHPDCVKIMFGNLPIDVDPCELATALDAHLKAELTKGGVDVSTAMLDKPMVATFGPCRPKTRRDRDRLHRGFAVCAFANEAVALKVHDLIRGSTFVSSSKRTPTRELSARLDVKRECDEAFIRGLVGKAPVVVKTESKKPTRAKWSMKDLDEFPMRANCLSTHTRFSDLSGALRVRMLEYLSTSVTTMPELAGIILAMEKVSPEYIRVKEVIESVEAFKVIVAYLNTAEQSAKKRFEEFFDLACGHGLVGVLLAYAFPQRTVRSFDWKRRKSFYAFASAFASMRASSETWSSASIDWDEAQRFEPSNRFENSKSSPDSDAFDDGDEQNMALDNIKFTRGDIDAAKTFVNSQSFVVALHGCNEANKSSVEMAIDAGAGWVVMPCCIKSNLYLPECTVTKLSDDAKYAFLCGVMAQKYTAQMSRCIDARITTRALLLCGGVKGYTKQLFYAANADVLNAHKKRRADASPKNE